MTGLSRT